jgi:hypothetical protein
MYLGDERQVVEASVEEGEVRIAGIEEYCDGKSILRFRRSKKVRRERDGWKLCICAIDHSRKGVGKGLSFGNGLLQPEA